MIIAKTKSKSERFIKSIDNSLIDLPGLEEFVKEDIYNFLYNNFDIPNEYRLRIALHDINIVTKEYIAALQSNFIKEPFPFKRVTSY